MTFFEAHFGQAHQNIILFNDLINRHPGNWLDWKTTLAYYAAIHIVRAHIALCIGEQDYLDQLQDEENKKIVREITIHQGLIKVFATPQNATSQRLRNVIASNLNYDPLHELHKISDKARYLKTISILHIQQGSNTPFLSNINTLLGNWIVEKDVENAHRYLTDICSFFHSCHHNQGALPTPNAP